MEDSKIINEISKLDGRVEVVAGNLKVTIPKNASLPPELQQSIRDNKESLIQFLNDLKAEIIPKAQKQDGYILSAAQKRLFFVYEFNKESLAYNMPQFLKIEGDLNYDKLQGVFEKLIRRHESLRTSFELFEGKPQQKVVDELGFDIEQYDCNQKSVEANIQAFVRPFELQKAPLFRVGVLEIGEGECLLMVDMHHIISDGISQSILIRDFTSLYNNVELPELRIQYKDFSEWQQTETRKTKKAQDKSFWLNRFAGDLPRLQLPADFSRPGIQDFAGGSVNFEIGHIEKNRLKELANQAGGTLYMVLLSLYTVLLSKLTSQEDILLGTIQADRQDEELDHVIGLFVNTLVLRNFPTGDKPFIEFVCDVKQSTQESFSRQSYQFEDLIEDLKVDRDTSRNPLFDAMFVFQNYETEELRLPGLKLKPYEVENVFSKFDITLTVSEDIDKLFMNFEYATSLFKRETIEGFVTCFKEIVKSVVYDESVKISDIRILPQSRQQSQIEYYRGAGASCPAKTIVDIFNEQQSSCPQNLALTITGQKSLTYGELETLSNKIANYICSKIEVEADDRIGIELGRDEWLIAGIMAILKTGGAYVPIDPDYPVQRKEYIKQDSKCKLIIDDDFIAGFKLIEDALSALPLHIEIKPSCLAYIIYTSGTTGKPKGVMVEHRNLVSLLFSEGNPFDFGTEDVWTLFHSPCFDFSVWEIFGSLLTGGRLVLFPGMLSKDPEAYHDILLQEKVTILNQTPSAFNNLSLVEEKKSQKKLSVRSVIFGGEALKPKTLATWNKRYPDVKLINMFGITETTIHVTYKEIGVSEIKNNISNIGTTLTSLRAVVLDNNKQVLPPGLVGELYVGGAGVSRGYLGKPELTSEKFLHDHFAGSGFMYRTGDKVKLLPNGEMEYIGRADDQVQLRGFRIELGEIESHLMSIESIRDAVVVNVQEGDSQYLVGYYVSDTAIEAENIQSHLQSCLPEYMVPSYFVCLDEIPLNANGKLDRKSLPSPNIIAGADYVAPANELEGALVRIWGEVLALNKADLSVQNNFFAVGGDSIKVLRLISAINDELRSKLSVIDVYQKQTIKELARLIEQKKHEIDDELLQRELEKEIIAKTELFRQTSSLKFEDIEDVYPMTELQKGMVFHLMKNKGVYHDQMVHVVSYEEFSPSLFEKAVHLMTEKHAVLRTGFEIEGDNYFQCVYKEINPEIEFFLDTEQSAEEQKEFIAHSLQSDLDRGFELKNPGLWRMKIFNLGGNHYCICFIFHHAIIDGWSDANFNTELNNTYLALKSNDALKLRKLESSFKDYAVSDYIAQRNPNISSFWENELKAYIRFSFPSKESFREQKFERKTFNAGLYRQLQVSRQQLNTTIKNICYSAFVFALNMFSRENDITTGLVTNNRLPVKDGDKVLGCFLNTIPVRIVVPPKSSIKSFIQKIDSKLLEIKGFDSLSLQKISNAIGETHQEGNLVTDVLYNFMDYHVYEHLHYDEKHTSERAEELISRDNSLLDLNNTLGNVPFVIHLRINDGVLGYTLDYLTSFVTEDAVKEFCHYFNAFLEQVARDVNAPLTKEQFLLEQHKTLIAKRNDTDISFNIEKTLADLFEGQVDNCPGQIALVSGSEALSYAELNKNANKIAAGLLQNGVSSGDVVGLVMPRSIKLIATMIAIAKINAVYLPLDPSIPEDRLKYIFSDCGAKCVVMNGTEKHKKALLVDDLLKYSDESVSLAGFQRKKDDLAYIIYTSGSTGKPKGVKVPQQGIVNTVYSFEHFFGAVEGKRMSQSANISFDAACFEIWSCLALGGTLDILPEELRLSPPLIKDWLLERGVQLSFQPTPIGEALIKENWDEQESSLEKLLIAGDRLNYNTATIVPFDVYNLYGPTEDSVWTTAEKISFAEDKQNYTIGKPICNKQVVVVDSNNQIQPVGVYGELCIEGRGLADGYVDQVLTESKFVPSVLNPGEKMYMTGDVGRWNAEGEIEFVGRVDNQVKIRGLRIELGEIEFLLKELEWIDDAVVIVSGTGVSASLVAFCMTEEEIDAESTKRELSQKVPLYMIPSKYVRISEIPLNSNGKVDRKSLENAELTENKIIELPQNQLEERLLKVWASVLEKDENLLSVNESFFEMGGNSLMVMEFTMEVVKNFNVNVEVNTVFEYPTIKTLASFLSSEDEALSVSTDETESDFEDALDFIQGLDS